MPQINFNTKHIKKGEPLPPYNGKLRLYNMRYCPFAQRAVLALNAKGLDYEVVNIDLMNKPEGLTQKSAFGKVPALEIADGVSIYESLIVVEYLDDAYPQRPLLSKDPVKKAYDKIIVEAFNGVTALFYRAITNSPITPDVQAAFDRALEFIQDQLKQRGTPFLGGEEPGYADYMIWPWFEKISLLGGIDGHATIDPTKYKLLTEYIERMFKDPAVAQYLIPKDVLSKFFDAYKKKTNINYDMLLDQ